MVANPRAMPVAASAAASSPIEYWGLERLRPRPQIPVLAFPPSGLTKRVVLAFPPSGITKRAASVLTYRSTFRSDARQSLGENRALRAGALEDLGSSELERWLGVEQAPLNRFGDVRSLHAGVAF